MPAISPRRHSLEFIPSMTKFRGDDDWALVELPALSENCSACPTSEAVISAIHIGDIGLPAGRARWPGSKIGS